MSNWIEICKAGTFTAKNGVPVTLTRGDLGNIAGSYDPAKREAPLVFGHPEDNDPAYGWVEKVKRVGDVLKARFRQVPEAVKKLVDAGHYKKVSISLAADKTTLRHVGLLGAVPPAVPGLADVKFKSGETDLTIDFSTTKPKEDDVDKQELEQKLAQETTAREAAQAEAKAAQKKADDAEKQLSDSKQQALEVRMDARIDKLVGKKILAADKPRIKTLALALGKTGDEIELSEGTGKKGLDEHLFDFLSGLPDLGLTHEFSDPGQKDEQAGIDTNKMMTRV